MSQTKKTVEVSPGGSLTVPAQVNKQERFAIWKRLLGSRNGMLGLSVTLLVVILALVGPALAPYDPLHQNLALELQPPSWAHWFGTDEVGRDLFSRVLVGSQQSILAGLVVVAIAGMIGSLLGCLSGVLGGRADAIIMRIMDIMLSIP